MMISLQKFYHFQVKRYILEILGMKFRKQAMIFCGSSGSTNYDKDDHLVLNRGHIQSYLNLQHEKAKMDSILKQSKKQLITKASQIFTDIKLASAYSGESTKYLSTCESQKNQYKSETDQINALELSNYFDFMLDDLKTQASIILQNCSTLSDNLDSLDDRYEVQSMSDVISVHNLQ